MKIGFVGLGIMGSRMCANLLKNDLEVGVYNRTREKAQKLVDDGAKFFRTPKELSEWADAVIVMVSDDEAVRDSAGQLSLEGKILVNMSTISLDMVRELVKKSEAENFEFVNAPVSGTKQPAERGELVILFGGNRNLMEKLKPAFDAMGKATIYSGKQEDSEKMKLAVNFMLAGVMESFAEAAAISKKIGLDEGKFIETIKNGPVGSPFIALKASNLLEKNFEPSFMTKHMLKDLKYLRKELESKGAGIKSNVTELFGEANKEYPEEDLSAIYKLFK